MKSLYAFCLSALFVFAGTVTADEGLKSGPQVGDGVGAFYVTKLCGAEDDGVKEGKNLCYRCKNGRRPQVMVFTRSSDAKVADLVKKLDKAVSDNEDSQLRVFVNFMGDSKDDVRETAEKFAAASKAKNIPFVLPNEFENGPDNYGINKKADITIVMAESSKVKASHAVSKAGELDVDAVIKDLDKILK